MMRKLLLMTAVLVAAVIVFLLATLPPAPLRAAWDGDPGLVTRTVAGAYHVHTTRSDGAGDRPAVAAAAASAGLQFVIFTDHGDGTRAPEPPAYLSGVLCIDGVEISTNGGHYVALGMPASPYRLGGEAEAVIEDVARLGGFGVAAHPDSARAELAWADWTLAFDGIEWLNADSEWRDEPRPRLVRALFDYILRPGPALASMLDRPVATLTRWDTAASRRPIVALAAHDAHGGIGRGVEDGGRRGLAVPSYEASFRSFSTRAVLDAPLSGQAGADARAVLAAIRQGRVFTALDAVAGPAVLDLNGDADGVRAAASMPPGATLVLLRDGDEVASTTRAQATAKPAPGSFRVEVRVPGAPGVPPVPWLVSNGVYTVAPAVAAPAPEPDVRLAAWPDGLTWHVEHDPASTGALPASEDGRIVLEYRLGPGERASQFAALVTDLPTGLAAAPGVSLVLRGARPMRVSVQVRTGGGERWGRSVYVPAEPREVRVHVEGMLPLDGQTGSLADLRSARALLLVVDLVNARPGDTGALEVSRPRVLTRDASGPGQSPGAPR